ncbi:uncharacterized protein LOC118437715 [Folsomia candida]|uniref:uncharacterized protein LOC118437715 n=1 Tax=Folsomia candida TaxID=158441 RepID=UPI001604D6F6|nr:uncharacterized protein LOC118437715 [Folsomia candida]
MKMTKNSSTLTVPPATLWYIVTLIIVTIIMAPCPCRGHVSLVISHWNNVPITASSRGVVLSSLVTGLRQGEEDHKNHIRLSPGNFLHPEDGLFSYAEKSANGTWRRDYYKLWKNLLWDRLGATAVAVTHSDLRMGIDLLSNVMIGEKLLLCNVVHPRPYQVIQWVPFHTHVTHEDDTGLEFLVGIVGILPFFKGLRGHLEVNEVTGSIRAVVSEAMHESTSAIRFFIVVGDVGVELGRKIMDAVPQVGVIVSGEALGFGEKGGHVLYKGGVIASAGVGGGTLGRVHIQIDHETGSVIKVEASLVQNEFDPDPETDRTLNAIRNLTQSKIVGRVGFRLDESCRHDEDDKVSSGQCLIGNIVADAMSRCVDRSSVIANNLGLKSYGDKAVLGLWHEDGLTPDKVSLPAFHDIREIDVHRWMPFLDSASLWRITGGALIKLFETHSTRLFVSDQLRVEFAGSKLHSVSHSWRNGDSVISKEEEFLVLIPSFFITPNATATSGWLEEYNVPIVDVRCLLRLFNETEGLISWGGETRRIVASASWSWWINSVLLVVIVVLISLLLYGRMRGDDKGAKRGRSDTTCPWGGLTRSKVIRVADEHEAEGTTSSWPLIERRPSLHHHQNIHD